jgi:hypothetical protein
MMDLLLAPASAPFLLIAASVVCVVLLAFAIARGGLRWWRWALVAGTLLLLTAGAVVVIGTE